MSNAEKMVSVQRGLLMEAEASLRASGMAVTLSADIREVLDQSVEVTGSDVIRWMDEYADEQRRGEPIGRLMRDKNERIVIVPIGDPHITDGMLVYASADAGEVERLRAELTEQREIFAMQEDKIDSLRAQLASANADKDAYAQNAIDLRDSLVEIKRIDAAMTKDK